MAKARTRGAWVMGLSSEQAAMALGMTVRSFLAKVERGKLPRPKVIGDLKRWDAYEVIGWPIFVENAIADTTVYVIGFGAYVKIGFTAGPIETRIARLQTGSPEKLVVIAEIVGDRSLEAGLHKQFRQQRAQGEWFRREGALADWIAEGCPA